ncbi:hypothetical protein C8Q74DRAFT_1215692 [Fomes fomentarius]|nr:hypothetical protein C8Q74DRAFT_1215692 [Fomes fomentarius]
MSNFETVTSRASSVYSNTFLALLNGRKSLITEHRSIMNEAMPFKSTILRSTGSNARMEIGRGTKQTNSNDNIELKVVTMLVPDTNSVSDIDSPGEEAIAV